MINITLFCAICVLATVTRTFFLIEVVLVILNLITLSNLNIDNGSGCDIQICIWFFFATINMVVSLITYKRSLIDFINIIFGIIILINASHYYENRLLCPENIVMTPIYNLTNLFIVSQSMYYYTYSFTLCCYVIINFVHDV